MKNSTTIKVPKKYQHMIAKIYHDEDGYWCITAKGFQAASVDRGCHTIHEDTQQEILGHIRMIEPCDCKQCLAKPFR